MTKLPENAKPLRYGENPQQNAWFVSTSDVGLGGAELIQGKELSYNNISDADAALNCVSEFIRPACAIIKHANPCGVAVRRSLLEAYEIAFQCDTTSAFGGVVAFNRALDADTARKVIEIFTEVVIAPGASAEAIEVFSSKKNLRLLLAKRLPDPTQPRQVTHHVSGGYLVQDYDTAIVDNMKLKVVTDRQPTDAELDDLHFAFKVAKHVKSNAIVYAKDCATVGIGAGQMSRVDSSRIAAWKAEAKAKGSVVASDAFFPFADGLLAAAEAGATAVIQPGGSMRDEEVIAAANEAGLAMVFTGHRHFKH
jgi:phosphoribosylaminoimidazolecarboxamide formyltransferase/IMP cyclohydrolase